MADQNRGTAPGTDDVLVGIVMGSTSDWPTMKNAADVLEALEIPHETRVVSAHRTPDMLFQYAERAAERGLRAIIAGAGGAAHLPGMLASKTWVPVLGVPSVSAIPNPKDEGGRWNLLGFERIDRRWTIDVQARRWQPAQQRFVDGGGYRLR